MQKVKFRAWFKNEGEMKNVAINNVYEGNKTYLHLSPLPMNDYKPIDLMQYTGLKDKNGREIYEGDIVRFVDFDSSGGQRADREITGVIKYQSGLYEIWKNNDSEFFDSDGAFILNHAWLQDDEFEVIGNIYENSELTDGENL